MPYDRLYSCSLAEEPLFFLFRVWRVACLGNAGYHDVRLSARFLPAIPSVPRGSFDFPATETLSKIKSLDLPGIALAHLEVLCMSRVAAETDDFIQEFRIGGELDVLLLHRRVDKGRLLRIGLASASILPSFLFPFSFRLSSSSRLTRMLSLRINSIPASPMRWRNSTSSVGTQGLAMVKDPIQQKYW